MRAMEGYSLLELLIALLLSTLLMGAILSLLQQTQRVVLVMQGVVEKESNNCLLPILLARWVKSAGNTIGSYEARDAIAIDDRELALRSDIDGALGFPDGSWDESFEDLRLRARRGQLQLRSGSGSFQSVAKGVRSVRFTMDRPRLLEIKLETAASFDLVKTLEKEEPLRLQLFLPNQRAGGAP